ncbi:hypothetical protein CEV33_4828, partial [Brucella grignonensis]
MEPADAAFPTSQKTQPAQNETSGTDADQLLAGPGAVAQVLSRRAMNIGT